jgi:hypothetical protein
VSSRGHVAPCVKATRAARDAPTSGRSALPPRSSSIPKKAAHLRWLEPEDRQPELPARFRHPGSAAELPAFPIHTRPFRGWDSGSEEERCVGARPASEGNTYLDKSV